MTEAGPGGLMRAYSGCLQEGMKILPTAIMTLGKKIKIYTDYNTIGNILHKLTNDNLPIDESEYTDIITITLTIEINKVEQFINDITEISSGKSRVEIIEELYFEKKM